MRIFHIRGDQFSELLELPETAPADGYLWVGIARPSFEAKITVVGVPDKVG